MIDNLIDILKKNYRLKGKLKVSLLRESPDNLIYLVKVEDKNRYILRVSKRAVGDDVLFELLALKKLSELKAPVVPPVSQADTNLFVGNKNTRQVYVLFKFAKGEHEIVNKDVKPSLTRVKSAGAALGHLHRCSMDMDFTERRGRNICTELNRVDNNIDRFLSVYMDTNEFVSQVGSYTKWANGQIDKVGLINNDYRPGNVFFKQDRVITILDFDWSCIGPFIKDVALGAVEWSYPDGAEEQWYDVFETFIEGYNSRSEIKVNIDNHLFRWMAFACLSDASTYFCDLLNEEGFSEKRQLKSYMYKKFKLFDRLANKK